MNPEKELALRELSSRHLLPFRMSMTENFDLSWHHKLLASTLERVALGNCRIIITMPPRHSKSFFASEAFPAWFMGKYPGNPFISTSYNAELAQTFGRKVRNMMQSPQYLNIFPEARLSDDSKAVDKLSTVQGSEYFAVGMGGALTGRGGYVLSIDDPIKNFEDAQSETVREKQWEWYQSTLYTRLMPGGSIVLTLTRWHEDDLAGRLIDQGGFEVLEMPAIATEDDEYRKKGEALWPSWFPVETLDETKKSVGPYVWSALYQCKPTGEENMEFRPGWIKYVDEFPALGETYITVDTAMSKKDSADYTGFTIARIDREGNWYLKAWHERLNPEELTTELFRLFDEYHPNAIGIEKTTFTVGLKPYIDRISRDRQVFLPIVELSHGNTKKEIRIRGMIPVYSSGSVYHLKDQCEDLEKEMRSFPNGKHDDCLDSASYLLQLVKTKRIEKPSFQYTSFNRAKHDATSVYLAIDIGDVDAYGFTLNLVHPDGTWNLKSWEDSLDPDSLVNRIFGLHSWLEDEGLPLTRVVWPDTDFTRGIRKQLREEMRKRKRMFSIREVKATKLESARHALISRYKKGKIKHISKECDVLETEIMMYPDVNGAYAMNSACLLSDVAVGKTVKNEVGPISKFLG